MKDYVDVFENNIVVNIYTYHVSLVNIQDQVLVIFYYIVDNVHPFKNISNIFKNIISDRKIIFNDSIVLLNSDNVIHDVFYNVSSDDFSKRYLGDFENLIYFLDLFN